MEALYKVEDQSQEQRAYMILVCLVIITQDKLFNQNLHHLVRCLERTVCFSFYWLTCHVKMLDEVTWHKERLLRDISLGSLLVVVLVRSVQISLSKLRVLYYACLRFSSHRVMEWYGENRTPIYQCTAWRLWETCPCILKDCINMPLIGSSSSSRYIPNDTGHLRGA